MSWPGFPYMNSIILMVSEAKSILTWHSVLCTYSLNRYSRTMKLGKHLNSELWRHLHLRFQGPHTAFSKRERGNGDLANCRRGPGSASQLGLESHRSAGFSSPAASRDLSRELLGTTGLQFQIYLITDCLDRIRKSRGSSLVPELNKIVVYHKLINQGTAHSRDSCGSRAEVASFLCSPRGQLQSASLIRPCLLKVLVFCLSALLFTGHWAGQSML